MRFEIIVSRNGTPCETWEAEASSPEIAETRCHIHRTTTGEHFPGDTYRAVVPVSNDGDSMWVSIARADMANRWPDFLSLLEDDTDAEDRPAA